MRTTASLKGRYGVILFQREADVVQAIEQQVAAERLYLECRGNLLVIVPYALTVKINIQRISGRSLSLLQNPLNDILGQYHRKQAILEAVVKEYVGEARRDDTSETVVLQCPGRMLARRAGAEVATCDEHGRAFIAGLVQDEVGFV